MFLSIWYRGNTFHTSKPLFWMFQVIALLLNFYLVLLSFIGLLRDKLSYDIIRVRTPCNVVSGTSLTYVAKHWKHSGKKSDRNNTLKTLEMALRSLRKFRIEGILNYILILFIFTSYFFMLAEKQHSAPISWMTFLA